MWIKLNENLPDYGDVVLVKLKKGGYGIATYVYNFLPVYIESEGEEIFFESEVIAWKEISHIE